MRMRETKVSNTTPPNNIPLRYAKTDFNFCIIFWKRSSVAALTYVMKMANFLRQIGSYVVFKQLQYYVLSVQSKGTN